MRQIPVDIVNHEKRSGAKLGQDIERTGISRLAVDQAEIERAIIHRLRLCDVFCLPVAFSVIHLLQKVALAYKVADLGIPKRVILHGDQVPQTAREPDGAAARAELDPDIVGSKGLTQEVNRLLRQPRVLRVARLVIYD